MTRCPEGDPRCMCQAPMDPEPGVPSVEERERIAYRRGVKDVVSEIMRLAEEYDLLPVTYVRGPISGHGPSIADRLRALASKHTGGGHGG